MATHKQHTGGDLIAEHIEFSKLKKASRILINLSSEKLDYESFKEYIDDYINNAEEYDIDENEEYMEALFLAQSNLFLVYGEYVKHFKKS